MKAAIMAVWAWLKAAVLNILAGAGSKRLIMTVVVAVGIIKVLKVPGTVAAICATALAIAYIASETIIKLKK